MAYPNIDVFLEKLKNISSFSGRVKFADEQLTRIGSGSGRIVYDLDDKVLKLARNAKGIAQNEEEVNVTIYDDYEDILTKVYDYDDNHYYVIAEKAEKVTKSKFREIVGVDIYDLYRYIKNFYELNRGGKNAYSIEDEKIEQLNENEFVQQLMSFTHDYDQKVIDYGRPSTYGIVNRDGTQKIVLTDYGLSDEVYKTHYERKSKYGIYEIVGLAGGQLGHGRGDDFQDWTDGEEIRNSMWAIQPYSVSDGGNNINERVVSFIENRSEYGNKPIKNLPELTDVFYECYNNLKEAVKKANNKQRFYENLLSLQEYLSENKFFDRENLKLEQIETKKVPDVKAYSLERNRADELAEIYANKMDLHTPHYMGEGTYGFAYEIGDNVLKLTTDTSEVEAGLKIMEENPERIANIYNIHKIVDSEKEDAYYVIIQENIREKKVSRYNELINIIDDVADDRDKDFVGLMIWMKRRFDYDEFLEKIKFILHENPDAGVSDEERQEAYEFIKGIGEIKRNLDEIGITKTIDYSNVENLGYKDGELTYFDVGGYVTTEPPLSDDQIVYLPENEDEKIYDKDEIDMVANKVATKLNIENIKYLGQGEFGKAYTLSENKVLKITTDKSEAVESKKIEGKDLQYIANIYKIYKIISKSLDRQYYAIILEKLDARPDDFKRLFERLNIVFTDILKIPTSSGSETKSIDAIIDDYLYDRMTYREYEDKIKKYMSKNPNDGSLFYSLLNIADELVKYNVETIDFLNYKNLGYKNNNISFFDLGFGGLEFEGGEPEEIEIEEGAPLFSSDDEVGYEKTVSSGEYDGTQPPSNDLNANSALYDYMPENNAEELIEMDENRKKAYMPGSKEFKVKDKYRLGGLPDGTSVAGNQGDIGILDFTPISENEEENIPINKVNDFVSYLRGKDFIKTLIKNGGVVWAVGGIVRDLILNKPSKDIDLVVGKIPIDELSSHLEQFGNLDLVGKTFGVLKFIDKEGVDYDVALPRKDKPTGEGGYRGFETQSDPNMSIEDDLIRRDVKFNSMAININTGKFLDPLGGLEDIKKSEVSATNPKAFSDDPLRMLRTVQFSSRFSFDIEPETFEMIKSNAHWIGDISSERIMTEFNKIVEKGDIRKGIQLLKDTNLLANIFGFDIEQSTIDRSPFEDVKKISEFIFLVTRSRTNPDEYYLNTFATKDAKKDKIYKDIQAFNIAYSYADRDDKAVTRAIAAKMYNISPESLKSMILPQTIEDAADDLLRKGYPKTAKELDTTGNDLMQIGFKGKEIGDAQKKLLLNVYADNVKNNKEDLIKFLK